MEVEKVEDMSEKVVDLTKFSVLVKAEVGLAMHFVTTNYSNNPDP